MQLDKQVSSVLEKNRQTHLVQFWEELSEPQQGQLQEQVGAIDFPLLQTLIQKRDRQESDDSQENKAQLATSPEQLIRLPQAAEERKIQQRAEELGKQLLQSGKVGAILVAGGQGSRLGFDAPKGMYPIGPISDRTLFQVLSEHLLARSRHAGVSIPYFIMTSEATHVPTMNFFESQNYFGLGKENVYFFQQASLPAIEDNSHRIFLADKGEVATSPDGHGGMLRALAAHGMIEVMQARGVEHLFYHQVDNPTTIVCDPILLGLHIEQESDLTTKVVAKESPEERMGVLVTINGKTEIIEYSDLPAEEAYRKDESGNHIFWAGNTAIHVFRREFIESLIGGELSLPFHIAHKIVPHVDISSGRQIIPDSPNGNKFEQFIFDALPHARVALVVEGDRNREFNPVKNAEGKDSPATSRAALQRIAAEWVQQAGGIIQKNASLEISPLFALDSRELQAKLSENVSYSADTILSD